MENWIGELAALGTAISFSFGSTLFTLSGRRIGSPLVTRTRLFIAATAAILVHWIIIGEPLPLDAGAHPWFWLGLSGLVGLALGDASLFQAFVMLGPRLSMLVMALAPVLSVILAWLFLGETLTMRELTGIGLTVAGIAWVVSERRGRKRGFTPEVEDDDTTRTYIIGLLFALGGALGQAGGLILSKVGLANEFSPLSANAIRLFVAALFIWILPLLNRRLAQDVKTLRAQPVVVVMITIGALIGSTLGVWLSLVAVQRTEVGIASTLMALTPIFLLPVGYFVFKETISWQAILGTLLAFGGSALLFL